MFTMIERKHEAQLVDGDAAGERLQLIASYFCELDDELRTVKSAQLSSVELRQLSDRGETIARAKMGVELHDALRALLQLVDDERKTIEGDRA